MSLITLEKISKSFLDNDGSFEIIKNVNLEIKKDTLNILLGASGSGKTTLLNIIMGIESVSSGVVVKKDKLSMGYVTQHANFIDELTVEENLYLSVYKKRKEVNINSFANIFDCGSLLKKKPKHLSIGEKQRINILRALLSKPELLILDEPTAALDYDNKMKVVSFLQKIFNEGNLTIIIVTHDQEVVDFFKEKNIFMLKSKELIKC
ncbi:ABC transporter ATP-binding protein [archaeon]|nr:ABC transporter ATP-binding protein [archaeon]NCQ52005.1 ABC transporter ATP-binding protein [archaeon]